MYGLAVSSGLSGAAGLSTMAEALVLLPASFLLQNSYFKQSLKATTSLKNMAFLFCSLETGGVNNILVCLGTQDLVNKHYLSSAKT